MTFHEDRGPRERPPERPLPRPTNGLSDLQIEGRLKEIEVTIKQLATREYIEKKHRQMIVWTIGTVIGLVGAGAGILFALARFVAVFVGSGG